MCRIDYDDCDGVWLAEPHDVKARQDHTCLDCGRTIAKGETYTYGSWATEGTVMVCKMCAQCVAAGAWLRKVCGGHFWPGVIEELREHWDVSWWGGKGYRSLGLGRLVIAGETRWKRNGELVPVERVKAWAADALRHVPETAEVA